MVTPLTATAPFFPGRPASGPLDAILQESPLQPFNAYCRVLTDLIQPKTYFTRDDVQATDKSAS
ncbi:MAG: hypothetical protein KC474_03475 [Cyanobacteria bacterium HKST-UBA04]|nr:hypothetical protein [Cyanobacteria bacterium HKST-UBA04]MCA9841563.1 hypothetical protein [Cyanobacteria bacterium HKST-UBA03]